MEVANFVFNMWEHCFRNLIISQFVIVIFREFHFVLVSFKKCFGVVATYSLSIDAITGI